jgi:hypothetical protein
MHPSDARRALGVCDGVLERERSYASDASWLHAGMDLVTVL